MAVTAKLTRLDRADLDRAIDRGTQRLLELQRPDGVWVGELESNVTMTAQHLFWHHYLGLRTPDARPPHRERADGAHARRRHVGDLVRRPARPLDVDRGVRRAAACAASIRDRRRSRTSSARAASRRRASSRSASSRSSASGRGRRWRRSRPSSSCFRRSAPFSIYDFACWARQTFVALALAQSLRPVRPVGRRPARDRRDPGQTRPPRRPRALRRKAQQTAEQWIRARQEADGSWGGIQPPWVWSIIALAALGNGLDDPTVAKAVEGWNGFLVEDGDRLRPEACQSPVWDTALAVLALRACGVSADHPALVKAGDYLLREEVTVKGDWAIRKPGLAPGGWAFEYENDLYPDVDDAAVVSLTLHQLGIGDDAIGRGVDWLVGMQSKGGGWGAFDVDNQAMWLYKIPFCDFGKVTDEPSADVTAHALEVLGRARHPRRRAPSAASTGSSPSRRTTARGSAAGASTTSTARAPRCPALEAMRRPARPPGDAPRGRVARLRAAGERRLRRGHPLVRRSGVARPRRLHDRRRKPRGRCSATWPQETLRIRARAGRQTIFALRSVPTATGTSSTSPARDSRSTS